MTDYITHGDKSLLNEPVFAELGKKYGKTPAQVVLRWDIQSGIVTIPKSANPERMAENLDIFDFELDSSEMSALDQLETDAAVTDSDVFGH